MVCRNSIKIIVGPLYFSFHLFIYPARLYPSRAREWEGNQQASPASKQVLKVGGQREGSLYYAARLTTMVSLYCPDGV